MALKARDALCVVALVVACTGCPSQSPVEHLAPETQAEAVDGVVDGDIVDLAPETQAEAADAFSDAIALLLSELGSVLITLTEARQSAGTRYAQAISAADMAADEARASALTAAEEAVSQAVEAHERTNTSARAAYLAAKDAHDATCDAVYDAAVTGVQNAFAAGGNSVDADLAWKAAFVAHGLRGESDCGFFLRPPDQAESERLRSVMDNMVVALADATARYGYALVDAHAAHASAASEADAAYATTIQDASDTAITAVAQIASSFADTYADYTAAHVVAMSADAAAVTTYADAVVRFVEATRSFLLKTAIDYMSLGNSRAASNLVYHTDRGAATLTYAAVLADGDGQLSDPAAAEAHHADALTAYADAVTAAETARTDALDAALATFDSAYSEASAALRVAIETFDTAEADYAALVRDSTSR